MNEISLFIFRRDFRTSDNIGLATCVKNSTTVYPIFIFTKEQIGDENRYKSNNCVQFMLESLKELEKSIPLTFFFLKSATDTPKLITDLHKKLKITHIYTNTDYTQYAIKRETTLINICKKLSIEFKTHHDICLLPPGTVLNGGGEYYQKFTPFATMHFKNHKKIIRAPSKLSMKSFKNITSSSGIYGYTTLDTILKKYYVENDNILVRGGRTTALKQLSAIKNFKTYEKIRNDLSQHTTNMSAFIKFGCISIREVFDEICKKLGSKHTLVKQLIWRDFYYHLGYGFGDRFGKSLKPKYDNIKWKWNRRDFDKWCAGETGYPIVDAGIRELLTTGFMHNRCRMIVASFLIKNLGIDWRHGERFFATHLVDYDVLVNNGNWQWVSGSGADSQPYFRVFNPWMQSSKYDSDASYIKKWIPTLRDIPPKHLHEWNKYHTEYDLKKINYFKPMINYTETKTEVLKMYKSAI